MAIVLGIDKFMSECRALTNFIGNGVAASSPPGRESSTARCSPKASVAPSTPPTCEEPWKRASSEVDRRRNVVACTLPMLVGSVFSTIPDNLWGFLGILECPFHCQAAPVPGCSPTADRFELQSGADRKDRRRKSFHAT
jgi:hypothetical protein